MKRVGEPGVPFAAPAELPAAKKPRLHRALPATGRQQAAIDVERSLEERSRVSRGVRSSTDANHSYDDVRSSPEVTSHPDTSAQPPIAEPVAPDVRTVREAEIPMLPMWPSQRVSDLSQPPAVQGEVTAAVEPKPLPLSRVIWQTTSSAEMPSRFSEGDVDRWEREQDAIRRAHIDGAALFRLARLGPMYKSDRIARPSVLSMCELAKKLFAHVPYHVYGFQSKYPAYDRQRIQAVVMHVIAWQFLAYNEKSMSRDHDSTNDFPRRDYNSTMSIIDNLIRSDFTIDEIEIAMANLSSRAPTVRPSDVIHAAVNARSMIRNRSRNLQEIESIVQQFPNGVGAPINSATKAHVYRLIMIVSQLFMMPMIQILHRPYLAFIHGDVSVGQAFKDMFGGEAISTDPVPDIVCDVAAAIGSGTIERLRRREFEAGHDAPSQERETEAAREAVRKILSRYLNAELPRSKPFGEVPLSDPRHENVSVFQQFCQLVTNENAESLTPYKEHFKTWCAGVLARGLERRTPPTPSSSSGAV